MDDKQTAQDYIGQSILEGYRDAAEGRLIESSGDFKKDRAMFHQMEKVRREDT